MRISRSRAHKFAQKTVSRIDKDKTSSTYRANGGVHFTTAGKPLRSEKYPESNHSRDFFCPENSKHCFADNQCEAILYLKRKKIKV